MAYLSPHSLSAGLLATVAAGFQLAPEGTFAGLGLARACEQVLYSTVRCDSYVASLGQKMYHGSVGDKAFTDTVCSQTCSAALTTVRGRIVRVCASTPEIFEGYPVLSLVDSVVSGWNETCLKDADGAYCNGFTADKIEAFEPVDDLADMPRDELCSFCNVEKLRLMQKSPYSAYSSSDAERLSYINQNCGGTEAPTDPQQPAINPNGTVIETCVTGHQYTVQAGDTCNSIAQAKSVSAASLYYINPNLLDCNEPTPGIELCLPLSCESTYTVQEGDDCVAVGVDQATSWQNIVKWNSGLDSRCSNIWSPSNSSAYWGSVVCVSAPGGVPDDDPTDPDNEDGTGPGNGGIGGPGGSGNGWADAVVDPRRPAEEGDTCSRLIVNHAVPIGRFIQANPSLRSAERCSRYLRPSLWYCALPVRGFDASLS
ncbi:hypothetical protein PG993_006130 [Apiospora rasikravindrae]|uniref:LysM domain-containing protein n=1 Tax=Apiospora rasikravindrae TaxID=990691 RepID=A0ABR1TCK1_9PEZI